MGLNDNKRAALNNLFDILHHRSPLGSATRTVEPPVSRMEAEHGERKCSVVRWSPSRPGNLAPFSAESSPSASLRQALRGLDPASERRIGMLRAMADGRSRLGAPAPGFDGSIPSGTQAGHA